MVTVLINICMFLGHKLGLVILLGLALVQISQAESQEQAEFLDRSAWDSSANSYFDLPKSTTGAAAEPPATTDAALSEPLAAPTDAFADPLDPLLDPPVELPRVSWAFTEFPIWQEVIPGLQLLELPALSREGQEFSIALVRIDLAYFEFSIHTVQAPEQAMSLQEWQAEHNLVAVINASMYLPDKVTSTGFLRSGDHLNNPRIVNNFGAFFLARPKDASLPSALLLDRYEDNWQDNLDKYQDAVQNYRLISAGRKLLWSPSETTHSIAAVGRDGQGKILLIHCRTPLRGVDFGELLLSLPIDIRLVMYTEGGSQAGLLLHTQKVQKAWLGQLPIDFGGIRASNGAPLPSVIGLSQKVPR